MAEVVVDNNVTYVGNVDYDAQILANSKGDLVCFWGKNPADCMSLKYSTNGGATWLPAGDDRIVLFSSVGTGGGIIVNDQIVMWEYTAEVVNDVLYIALHKGPLGIQNVLFTKCDISTITNVATYSNWKSADGTPPPSEGNGSPGNGYDEFEDAYIDPSIAVKSDSEILITFAKSGTGSGNLYAKLWNGSVWSSPSKIIDAVEEMHGGVSSLKHTREGDWVVAITLDATDGFDYTIMTRCLSGTNPLTESNWKKFDGSAGYDIVLDYGDNGWANGMNWPNVLVDSNNYVHILALIKDSAGWTRIWHNYWKPGTGWVNGTTENSAGLQVGSVYPRVLAGSYRYMDGNVDSGGQVIVLYNAYNAGIESIFWDESGGWDEAGITEEVNGAKPNRMVVGEHYMRGIESNSPFLLGESNVQITSCMVPGAISGEPWWEEIRGGGGRASRNLLLPLQLSE